MNLDTTLHQIHQEDSGMAWARIPVGLQWDADFGVHEITRDGIANLVYAIALAAFEAMQDENYGEYMARILADPTVPRWVRP